MADPLAFYALKRKHAEIAGQLRKLEADLAATEHALRLCGYAGDFSEIKPACGVASGYSGVASYGGSCSTFCGTGGVRRSMRRSPPK